MSVLIRPMRPEDVPVAVELQKVAFPPPFREDYHWDPEHLLHQIEVFPEGQFVAEVDGKVVGSCDNCIVSEARWQEHASWGRTVGGPFIRNHDPNGSTLYGLDITVHPSVRRTGVGRAFYERRFAMVRERPNLVRYGTGVRIPDYRATAEAHPGLTPEEYARAVAEGRFADRTLTPMLRYGLRLLDVIHNYMPDEESMNSAALLEWTP